MNDIFSNTKDFNGSPVDFKRGLLWCRVDKDSVLFVSGGGDSKRSLSLTKGEFDAQTTLAPHLTKKMAHIEAGQKETRGLKKMNRKIKFGCKKGGLKRNHWPTKWEV